ncbi:MAG: hypothetical protein U0Q18_19670 [Bryobacteraceae bacterium]
MKVFTRPTYLILGFLAALTLAGAVQNLNAQPWSGSDCSYLVVNRSFSQAFTGTLNMPVYGIPAPPGIGTVPNGGAGFITFLPNHKLGGQVTLAIGQLALIPDIVFDTNSSVYSLSWDKSMQPSVCSGTMTFIAPGEAPFDFHVVVSPDGRQIQMIHTDIGLTVGITGYPVEISGCTNRSIHGAYSYTVNGWGMAGGSFSFLPEQLLGGYFPFVMSGSMAFNPRTPGAGGPDTGSIALSDYYSVNGTILPRTATGWYSVKPNCTGSAVIVDSANGTQFGLELFVGNGGKALYLVNVDYVPGTPLPMWILGATLTRMGDFNWP